jgi:hypothetical protein
MSVSGTPAPTNAGLTPLFIRKLILSRPEIRRMRRRHRLLSAINAGLKEGKAPLDAYRQAVLQLHPTPADRRYAIGIINQHTRETK